MSYYISYINTIGEVESTLLEVYESQFFKEYLEKTVSKILFIEDVPEQIDNIRSMNLSIHNIEKLLCQHLEMRISRK